jgi:hypothetical protein
MLSAVACSQWLDGLVRFPLTIFVTSHAHDFSNSLRRLPRSLEVAAWRRHRSSTQHTINAGYVMLCLFTKGNICTTWQ